MFDSSESQGGKRHGENRLPISNYLRNQDPSSSIGFGSARRATALVTFGFGLSVLSASILAHDPFLAVLSSFHFPVVLLTAAVVIGVGMFMCGLYMAMTLRDSRILASRLEEARRGSENSRDANNETAPTCFERLLNCCS